MKADVYINVLNAFLSCILKTPVKNLEEICMHDECNAPFGLSPSVQKYRLYLWPEFPWCRRVITP